MFRQLVFVSLLLIQQGYRSCVRANYQRGTEILDDDLLNKIFRDQRSEGQKNVEPAPQTAVASSGNGIAKDAQEPGIQHGTSRVNKPHFVPSKTTQAKNHTNYANTPQPLVHHPPAGGSKEAATSLLFIGVVTACSVVGLVGIIMAGVCWYRLHHRAKAASDVDYPAYGVTGPTKDRIPSPGDRKLAQSAQMYHYQHQKQQMIAMEKANGEMKHDASDEESEEENEEGDYTVYECPGLAPTGEMEVKNPLFNDDTPVTPNTDDHRGDGN